MRLLYKTGGGSFRHTKDLGRNERPEYAILSHTWFLDDEKEVTYKDFLQGTAQFKKEGYAKIQFCGEQAAKDGLDYFWLDTCCIDKPNSSELLEAITSMFSWYRDASRCYVYLSDVSVGDSVDPTESPPVYLWESAFRKSRWFTRGWTLQELIAPRSVEFFSKEGVKLGNKTDLIHIIHEITKIPIEALQGKPLSTFTVEERLSWAEHRQTKRTEDKAYCMLGIFGIFMPLIYGEGANASTRLKRQITIDTSAIDTLPFVGEAAFNSQHQGEEATCLTNTRTELLQHIYQWIDGPDERCIFWLNGIAGTGKSTVARTVARHYYDSDDPRGTVLGGSFFFSKSGGESGNLNKARMLATSLARQLADQIPEAKAHVREAINERGDISEIVLRDQWKRLIIEPLSKLSSPSSPRTVLIVLDALDECDNENDVRAIFKALTMARLLERVRLRIFVTSRPDTQIRYGFNKIPKPEREVFILHDIPRDVVDQDLSVFFENKLTAIREERGFEEGWLGKHISHIIKKLVQVSDGLFIWAATACRFIREGRRLNLMRKRINRLIRGFASGAGPEKQLDLIYTAVLREHIMQQVFDDEMEKNEVYEELREVLGTVSILRSTLAIGPLARLLNKDTNEVKDTLADLHTIFNIPSDESRPVRLHHPTFRDFLLNKKRCVDTDFWVDEKKAHQVLGDKCIDLMSKMLRENICNLQSPGTLVSDISPDHIKRCIPAELQYACLYWVEHYRRSEIILRDGDRVHTFLKKYFLCWLEAINLMGRSADMSAIIRLYDAFLIPDLNAHQKPFVSDARRLMFNFGNIIRQAPLQTYCAALAFVPSTNGLKTHFRNQTHPWIESVRIADADVPSPKDESNYVSDLAFTPDSRRLASASKCEAVRAWDVPTKATLRKYEGDAKDKISSVAISPDGRTIAAGSDDFWVMAWDVQTGKLHYSIKAHNGWVNSVFFSPDGSLLASGSMDETVAIWDAATGILIERINNEKRGVNSVAFSLDGSFVATGSVDETVRIWEVSNNSGEVHKTLDGHTSPINSVRFSPSGKQLVSGSDDMTIRIWDVDAETELRSLRGHTRKVSAVSFSPNARLIVSGSEDKTVRVWEATTGSQVCILRDHRSGINAVVFSPDYLLLASSSFDDEVRLWDTKSWTLNGKLQEFPEDVSFGRWATHLSSLLGSDETSEITRTFKGHSKGVTCTIFSPDGQWLASGSEDTTIKLWLGAEERWTLKGHTARINHLAFSPDIRLLASASGDKTVKLWDIATGETSFLLDGHSDSVFLVLFSSNGRILGSCSADNTVMLWDPETGERVGSLSQHSGPVNGFAFSPDDALLVSWSTDMTAILWDLSTKSLVASLSGHSRPLTSTVFSPDGTLLASCSEDDTIRLWTRGGLPRDRIRCDSKPVAAAFSPDNRYLAFSLINNKIHLLDLKTKGDRGSVDVGVVARRLSFSDCGGYIDTDRGSLDIRSFLIPPASGFQQRPYSLFVTQEWVRRDMDNTIWLPKDYHATDVATFGKTVVMGHASGSISFVRLA